MKKLNSVLWGIVLISAGVVLLIGALGTEIDVFFDGWWSLFIIVPCAINFVTERGRG